MKFNWGTGIVVFLAVFLLAAAAFIVFAFRQDVNLVHEEYYEKGVDYSAQMEVEKRSKEFRESVIQSEDSDFLVLEIEESLFSRIDSGNVLLYRPSNSEKDIEFPLNIQKRVIKVPKENLIKGRYILKVYWYSEGLKYEVDKALNIQ